MNIILNNTSDEPIYQQIISQIKAQIMNGTLAAGDALPSMRVLAAQLKISVITTKRAYEELERDGYTYSVPGKGCFVKGQNTDFLREEIVRQTEESLKTICEKAKIANLTAEDLKEMIDMLYGGEI